MLVERGTNELRRFNALVAQADAVATDPGYAQFERIKLQSHVLRAGLTWALRGLGGEENAKARASVEEKLRQVSGLIASRGTAGGVGEGTEENDAHMPDQVQEAAFKSLVKNLQAYHRNLTAEPPHGLGGTRLLTRERAFLHDQCWTSIALITLHAVEQEGASDTRSENVADARARLRQQQRAARKSESRYATAKRQSQRARRDRPTHPGPVRAQFVRAMERVRVPGGRP